MPTTHHPLSAADRDAMTAVREFLRAAPDVSMSPDARPSYDEMIAQVPAASGVAHEPGELGGVPGWWCRVDDAAQRSVLLYLHGGAYVLGSAAAYRNTVGQLAARAGADAFVPDYALAPERPFPAALDDAVAAYDALVAEGCTRIALAGDSAGGGLALALLAVVGDRAVPPVATVAVSPWADLTLSGESMAARAPVDPLLDRERLAEAAALYLSGADASDPKASPVLGRFGRPVPVLLHVGEDEVLLDDSVRYAEHAERAGGDVDLHVWEGMVHVFTSNIALLDAAREATDHIGEFLALQLRDGAAR